MLRIVIPAQELWDEKREQFVNVKETKLGLEHSLVSISKWEAKWHKSFFSTLSKKEMTSEMMIDYIRHMTLTQNVDPDVYNYLSDENLREITEYIEDTHTATTIHNRNAMPRRDIITSELVYFWMVYWGIPFECQKWHINRLLILIEICGIKNQSGQKMSRQEQYSQNKALNAARRKQWNTKG